MFLKSIEIFGFKSFADKTLVQFEPGITSIVGPNGCGKSNIVDAIKWVFGEKQAKSLRGEKMEDVIFSGTEHRKQVSLSEVFVTIDNSDGILDIDSREVTVGRRIFRDGESEYLINKSPVRLKDIDQLFMDTGIGKTAYSVMEQGKMDLILSTRAEDRRYIFEEAAGISRYKMQKKESIKKLTETGENLERINDIIKEIEREKDFKAKQAERTKQYIALKKDMSMMDIKLNLLKHRELERRSRKIGEDIEKLAREREAISARVASTSAENEKDEKRKNDLQHQLFELEKRLHAYRIRVEDIDVKTDKNRSLIAEQKSRIENIQTKINERSEHLARLEDERTNSGRSRIEIIKKIEDDRVKLENMFNMRKRKIESIHENRDIIDKNKLTIKEYEKKLSEYRAALEEVIRKLVDAIEKRKDELAGSEEERLKVRAEIGRRMAEIESKIAESIKHIEEGLSDIGLDILRSVDINGLAGDISSFEGYEDGFRSILFDKTGIHAEKIEIDNKIGDTINSIESIRIEISRIEEQIHREQAELEDVNEMITRIEKDLSRNENESDWIDKHIRSLSAQLIDLGKQIDSLKEDTGRSEKTIKSLDDEINEWNQRLAEFHNRSDSLVKNIAELTGKRSGIEESIRDRKNVARKDEEELSKIIEKISGFDRQQVEVLFKKNGVEEYLWIEYERKISELSAVKIDESEAQSLAGGIQEIKKQIHDLGPINNLAIEEFQDLKKRFEYYINQRNDIEKARFDILSVIEDINKTSVEIFFDTFMKIQKNFSEIFQRLFEGGSASIEILEPENILESGIDILIRPPGKKLKSISLLSGGERALTAIALLFATYMVKPSPFCFLDEIDAPLDESNIGRFIKMLKEFARSTQFIIVTHNKKTMYISESIYGVTMEEPGVSKVVSLKMERIEGQ